MNVEHSCYYPGKFSPPTKYHLNTLFWLLTRPEVGQVNVVLGKDEPGELPQEQKAKLWELLLKSSMAPRASVIKSKDAGPLGEIYNIFSRKPDVNHYIALDEKSARNKKLQKKLDKFPNYSFQLTPSKFDKSSEAMLKAIQNDDKEAIKNLLPDDFSDSMVEAYIDILRVKNDVEAPEEKSPLLNYKEQYTEMFNDNFWNEVFKPLVTESDINIENEIFSAYNGRYLFDITQAYKLINSNQIKSHIKKFKPDMMHFLSHPDMQGTDSEKVKNLNVDYTKPIGLIVNVVDPDNGKKEWLLIDGNHRTRKAVEDKQQAEYIVVPNPDDVMKFMKFDKTKDHNLFPDDDN